MRKIVLLCALGMSTSILVRKMNEAAAELDYDCSVEAHPIVEAVNQCSDADIILLGPQVRFNQASIQNSLPDKPIEVIDMRLYGTMNGKAIIDNVRKVLGDS